MRVSEHFKGKYLKAADIPRPVEYTIRAVVEETMGQGRDAQVVWVAYFRGEEQGLVLNKTNAGTLANELGDETSEWPGARVTVYSTPVQYQGKTVDGLRVSVDREERASPRAKSHQRPLENRGSYAVESGRDPGERPAKRDDRRTTAELLDDEIPFGEDD